MDDHNAWDELAAGYALDALSSEEELTFTSHLETCARCQLNVDDHTLVAAQLGAIAMPEETVETPSWESMRDLVVGAGRDEAAVDDDRAPVPAGVADLAAHRRRRYDGSRRLLAAAAAVVVVAGGGIAVWRAEAGGSSANPSQLASCSPASGCHAITLHSASGADAVSLTVRGDTITMAPTNMSAAAPGSEYVLWQQPADGRPIAVKVFTATGNNAVATATTAAAYSDTTSFAISKESTGPAPAKPTTPLVAVGTAT
jgi:Anti-sigma-K factor rskA